MAEPTPSTSRTVRFIELNWGILLILFAWEAWVVINDFNPIVMPSPQGVFYDLITNPRIYLENTAATFLIALLVQRGRPFIGSMHGHGKGSDVILAAGFPRRHVVGQRAKIVLPATFPLLSQHREAENRLIAGTCFAVGSEH